MRNCITIMALLISSNLFAQIGEGWVEDQPKRKIHLVDFNYKGNSKGMYSFDWKAAAEVGESTPASS